MSGNSPFINFSSTTKPIIQKEHPEWDRKMVLKECLNRWDLLPEGERVYFQYEDFESMKCTYEKNGRTYVQQPWYHCKTCWPNKEDHGCCVVCSKKCHAGHELEYRGVISAFCDCGVSGKCKHCEGVQKTAAPPSQSGFGLFNANQKVEKIVLKPSKANKGGWKPPKQYDLESDAIKAPKNETPNSDIKGVFSTVYTGPFARNNPRGQVLANMKSTTMVIDPIFGPKKHPLQKPDEKEEESEPESEEVKNIQLEKQTWAENTPPPSNENPKRWKPFFENDGYDEEDFLLEMERCGGFNDGFNQKMFSGENFMMNPLQVENLQSLTSKQMDTPRLIEQPLNKTEPKKGSEIKVLDFDTAAHEIGLFQRRLANPSEKEASTIPRGFGFFSGKMNTNPDPNEGITTKVIVNQKKLTAHGPPQALDKKTSNPLPKTNSIAKQQEPIEDNIQNDISEPDLKNKIPSNSEEAFSLREQALLKKISLLEKEVQLMKEAINAKTQNSQASIEQVQTKVEEKEEQKPEHKKHKHKKHRKHKRKEDSSDEEIMMFFPPFMFPPGFY